MFYDNASSTESLTYLAYICAGLRTVERASAESCANDAVLCGWKLQWNQHAHPAASIWQPPRSCSLHHRGERQRKTRRK
jgi:hypothetical protein